MNGLHSLLVDLATALFSPVDIGRAAFGCLQLLARPRSFQLPLGHEVPRYAVVCVINLQAVEQRRRSKSVRVGGGSGVERRQGGKNAAAHSCRISSWRSWVKSKMAAMCRREITNSASVGHRKKEPWVLGNVSRQQHHS